MNLKAKLIRMRIKDVTLYVRASRVYHRVKRRRQSERDFAAVQMRRWRDDAWWSWRQLWEVEPHLSAKTPWALHSCRCGLLKVG